MMQIESATCFKITNIMQAKTERIAQNTIFLYMRTFITMLISLYTSRIVLKVLGVEDYGIYNVVGGISTSFVFLSAALANATHRFLSFEIGRKDERRLNQIFNQNIIIYSIYAIVALGIIEIGGGWLVLHKLSIPLDRLSSAMWVLHATSITLCVTILVSVYESVLISRENMKMCAYIGIYDATIKLLIAYMISIISYDKLKIYAILITIAVCLSKLFVFIYTRNNYKETRIKFFWDKSTFKSMFKFSTWNLIDASVFLLNDQGINMLLNVFFGPSINAARGISIQVKNAISNFSSGFLTAVRPQIVKSYSSGEIDYFKSLIYSSGKYSFFLLLIFSLPVILRVESILQFWLGNVPEMTIQFVIWMLIFSLINSLCDPFWQGIQAVGDLKWYVIIGNFIYVLAFPLSYFAFKQGCAPVITFQIISIIRFIYLFVVISIFKRYINIRIANYLRYVLWPILKVLIVSVGLTVLINSLIADSSIIHTLISCLVNAIITIIVILLFGMNYSERKTLGDYFRKVILKK